MLGYRMLRAVGVAGVAFAASPSLAQAPLTVKDMSVGLAIPMAEAAMENCRQQNGRCAVTVVNRAGQVVVVLRDDSVGPHSLEASRRKAYTSVTFRVTSGNFAGWTANPAAAGLATLPDVTTLTGGVPLMVDGVTIGAIGVGGLPTGTADEVAARAGIEKIADKLK